jgi:hypothetical protein
MENNERIRSTIDSLNQIKKQENEGHYCLHTAYIGRGRTMAKSGFEDFTLLYKDNAFEKLKKVINEEPRSKVYVEINYYVDKSRIAIWKYVTMDEYLVLPDSWKEFKKLIKK